MLLSVFLAIADPQSDDQGFADLFKEWESSDSSAPKPWERYRARPDPSFVYSTENSQTFIYDDEISRGPPLSVWQHTYFGDPRNKVASMVTRVELDCRGKERITAQTHYGEDGSAVWSFDDDDAKWTFIRPRTLTAALEKPLCQPE